MTKLNPVRRVLIYLLLVTLT